MWNITHIRNDFWYQTKIDFESKQTQKLLQNKNEHYERPSLTTYRGTDKITPNHIQIINTITNKLQLNYLYHCQKNLWKILNSIPNEGIRFSIDAFRTSPVNSVLYYAEELSLKLLREKDFLIYGIKKEISPNHIGHKHIFNNNTYPINTTGKIITIYSFIHDTFLQLDDKIKIFISVKNKMILQKCLPWLWKINLNTELTNPKIIISLFNEIIEENFHNFTQIYTDVSKSTLGVGFTVIEEEAISSINFPLKAAVS